MKFLKRLFCRHSDVFVRNIYGDEIIEWGWRRSLWKCEKCGRLKAHHGLVDPLKNAS